MGKRKISALKRLTTSPGDISSASKKNKTKKGSSGASTMATVPAVVVLPPAVRKSDDEPRTRPRWTNKQRVLIFSSRGIGYRDRHLMNDFKTIMPHSKGESKMNKKEKLVQINEACEMKNCNLTLYFEARKKKDLYMWLAKTPDGPSAKFLVENIHTMDELKMTGNCLKGSRPIVSFDKSFDSQPHFSLLRELFTQVGIFNHLFRH
jgi:ribosome biogenesis protein BRX1